MIAERQEKVQRVEQNRHAGRPAIEPRCKRGERGADGEGNEEEKADRDNEPERSQTIDHEALHHRTGTWFDAPDGVERRLQLEERAAGREDERDPANHCREQILVPPRRSLQQRLHGLAAFDSDQPLDLADDFTAHGFGAEERAGDGNRNQEDGRDREERVIRDRGAEAEQVVVPPGRDRTAEHANRVA